MDKLAGRVTGWALWWHTSPTTSSPAILPLHCLHCTITAMRQRKSSAYRPKTSNMQSSSQGPNVNMQHIELGTCSLPTQTWKDSVPNLNRPVQTQRVCNKHMSYCGLSLWVGADETSIRALRSRLSQISSWIWELCVSSYLHLRENNVFRQCRVKNLT